MELMINSEISYIYPGFWGFLGFFFPEIVCELQMQKKNYWLKVFVCLDFLFAFLILFISVF